LTKAPGAPALAEPGAFVPAATGPAAYRRIVLYIDDLDRCRADRVVEVLQAINLLSTTGLFVVVAAIEPGWVLQALAAQHARQITGADKQGPRALQFLDKLFPIAIAVRPMGALARSYLTGLLGEIERRPADAGQSHGENGGDFAAAPTELDEPASAGADQPDRQAGTVAGGVDGGVAEAAGQSGDVRRNPPHPPSRIRPEVSRISPDEAAFLPSLSGLLPGPRAAKRFANVYRLLHAGLGPDDLRTFLRRTSRGGAPFQASAVLLAGVVGWPEEAESLLQEVGTDCAVLTDATVQTSLRSVAALRATLTELAAKDFPILTDQRVWTDSARMVARYSVATYRSYAASRF